MCPPPASIARCHQPSSTPPAICGPSRIDTDSRRSTDGSWGGVCSTIDPPMRLRGRVWSAGKLLVLGGALIATYILFAAAAMRVALKAREVQIPDFTNKSAAEATALATNLGLAIKVEDNRRID